MQSLLVEGGPRLAAELLRADLVDKVLLFMAPAFAGAGRAFTPELGLPIDLEHLTVERVGEDVLLTAYVHSP